MLRRRSRRYREIVPHVKLSGPTSFAPAIYEAMRVVQESGGLFHILVILADGAITRSSALAPGQWSQQEVDTMEAIRRASKLPLSIVIVGLGDGPWDQMETFDDSVERDFDNVQVGRDRLAHEPGATRTRARCPSLAASRRVALE